MNLETLKTISGLVFLLITAFSLVMFIVLNYHWSNYGIDAWYTKKIQFAYALGTIVLSLLVIALFLVMLAL